MRSHRIGKVSRRVLLRRRASPAIGLAGFGELGKSLETIALKQAPASDVSGGNFDEALARWMARLQAQVDAKSQESILQIERTHPGLLKQPSHANFTRRRIVAERGPRYVRIVTRDVNPDGSLGGGSATAFVERTTGNVYKPASFKGPTRNFVRGNIFNAAQEPRTHY
jgi:hypothetical protein